MTSDTDATFSKRMKIIAGIVGNASILAEKTGISRRAIGLYLAGKSDPTREKLVVIASTANINLTWLATGDGQVFSQELQRESDTSSSSKLVKPAVQCCGEPVTFCSRFLQQDLEVLHENLLLMRIPDDAMKPTLRPNDLVLINREIGHVAQEGIYAIAMEETILVRRIQRSYDGTAYVICDNPLYEKQKLDRAEVTALKIKGKAIWAGKRI